MNIKENGREIIIKEIDYALKRMEETENPEEKLYFFSAIYAMIQRVFNIQYDSNLIYAHFILNETYKALQGRFKAIEQGADRLVPLTEEHFTTLHNLTKELLQNFIDEKNIDETLKKFVLLAYSTTGNGYYLFQKRLLKL
jgi:hypothetical protein